MVAVNEITNVGLWARLLHSVPFGGSRPFGYAEWSPPMVMVKELPEAPLL